MPKPQQHQSYWTPERRKAMSEKLKKCNAERKAKEVVVAAIQNDSVPEILRKIELQGKGLDAQNKVLFSKLYNLQVEVQILTSVFSKLLLTLSDCLAEPSSQTEAQAVVRDFLNHIIPKTK
jgi:hypothetical protein